MANIPKINNTYYMQIIIKFKKTAEVLEVLKYINNIYKTETKINVEIDINPLKI